MKSLCLLLLAAVLMLASAPVGLAADEDTSGAKHSKGVVGFPQPYKENKAWTYYKFAVTMQQTVTSFRPAPSPSISEDPNEPGAIATITSEIFSKSGEQVGIGSWQRIVVSNEPVDPAEPEGDRVARRLLHVLHEFGSAENEYRDTLSLTVTTKWLLSPTAPSSFVDYEGVVNGGSGKFLGAGGRMYVTDVVIEDNLLKEAVFNFAVYVPNDLPK